MKEETTILVDEKVLPENCLENAAAAADDDYCYIIILMLRIIIIIQVLSESALPVSMFDEIKVTIKSNASSNSTSNL